MTYISRKERIYVPRWLDESDAEYKLRAAQRKRSEGRLKRHISCDDLRAWVNDNSINNEYLLDLMSDGEAAGKNHVRLFGRYIPVPVLIKLVESVTDGNLTQENSEEKLLNEESLSQDFEPYKSPSSENAEAEPEGEFYGSPTKRAENIERENSKAGQSPKKKPKSSITENSAPSQKKGVSIVTEDSRASRTPKKRAESIGAEDSRAGQFSKEKGESFATEESKADDYDFLDNQTKGSSEANENLEFDDISTEKKFCECTILLDTAIGKLERIDKIASLAIAEAENAENEELKMGFDRKKSIYCCYNDSQMMQFDMQSKQNIKRTRDSVKYMELLRKISALRQKLKKVQDCRLKINEQMRMQREAKCYNQNNQVTELYSRREQAKVKTLQRKLEKLISTKGKLLSELTDAVSCLNKLKRSASRSRSTIFSKQNTSRLTFDQDENFRLGGPVPCACGCQCSDNNLDSSDTEKFEFSDSIISEMYCNGNSFQQNNEGLISTPAEIQRVFGNNNSKTNTEEQFYYHSNSTFKHRKYIDPEKDDYKNSSPEEFSPKESIKFESQPGPDSTTYESPTGLSSMRSESPSALKSMKTESPGTRRSEKPESPGTRRSEKPESPGTRRSEKPKSPGIRRSEKPKSPGTRRSEKPESASGRESSSNTFKGRTDVNKTSKPQKKSILKFVCPESSSKKNLDSEYLEYYQPGSNKQQNKKTMDSTNSRTPKSSTLEKYRRRNSSHPEKDRSSNTPSAEKDRRSNSSPFKGGLRHESVSRAPARKFRSETTMKEIEKALRNYDQRLNGLDSLENKIEKLREKLWDSNEKKHKLLNERGEGKKQQEAEWEKSNREITKLCSENWELRMQVQKLAAKSDIQSKKLQALKSKKRKVKELESEAEDLKKELLEYQDSFQDQRKCITMLESVVAVQRTEIEKLMSLIKKLTTMDRLSFYEDRKYVQRSRSYSPESLKSRRTYCKSRAYRHNASSDEDCSIVCCEDYQYEMRRNQQKNFDRRFCSPEPSNRFGWCAY